IQHEPLRELSFRIFEAAGMPAADARIVADHLVTSNLVGHDSHGVWHLPRYVRGIARRYVPWEEREVVRENVAMVAIDGHGANGIVAVTRAVDLAVARAPNSTFGAVGLRGLTHIGRLGDYPPRCAAAGMIGSVWLNGGGLFLSPYGSADRRLRPEPMAFAGPPTKGPPLILHL